MSWSRRQWLASTGAASGSALVALGCGGARLRVGGAQPEISSEEVRKWLREATEMVGGRWREVEAIAVRHEHTAAAVDGEGGRAAIARTSGALLAVGDGKGRRYEVSGSQLDRPGVLALAEHVLKIGEQRAAAATASSEKPAKPAAPQGAAAAPSAIAPFAAPSAAELLQQASELAARAERHASSRVVYRGAGIDLDATTVWYAGAGRDLEQRIIRRRDAVVAVAAQGGRPTGAEVASGRGAAQILRGAALIPGAPIDGGAAARMIERLMGRLGQLEGPSDAAIAAGLERALRLTTPQAVPAGAAEVVLDPSLVGALFEALCAAAAEPEQADALPRWRDRAATQRSQSASEAAEKARWQLFASPSTAGAYAGYAFDDRGGAAAPASPVEILRDGALSPMGAAALAPASLEEAPPGLRRRPGHVGAFSSRPPSHLELATEGVALEAMIGRVRYGFALEGASLARVDFAADRFTLRAQLARELARGTYSGRAFADVELSGSLAEFLLSIAAWSSERQGLSKRWPGAASDEARSSSSKLGDASDGERSSAQPGALGAPRFWSAELPSLLGRGWLAPQERT